MRKTMKELQDEWRTKYGHLSNEERMELIKRETREGLQNLKDAGIEPSMSADELMKLTRGDD